MHKRSILVVEDEPVIRMLAVEMLEDAGCHVIEFADADTAVDYCRDPEFEIAAVFTDINMLGALDGLDLVDVVTARHPEAVVVVASGRYGTRPAALPPTVSFLMKPWTEAMLLNALRDVIAAG